MTAVSSPAGGRRAAKATRAVVVLATVLVVLVWDPLGRHVLRPLGEIDMPAWISLPDLPHWLDFLLGPGKLIVFAVLVVLVGLARAERHRKKNRDPGPEGARSRRGHD